MNRNGHKQRKTRRGTDFRSKISVAMRRVLGHGWDELVSIQRQGGSFILRLRKVLDEKVVARIHEKMASLADRFGASYNYSSRTLSTAA